MTDCSFGCRAGRRFKSTFSKNITCISDRSRFIAREFTIFLLRKLGDSTIFGCTFKEFLPAGGVLKVFHSDMDTLLQDASSNELINLNAVKNKSLVTLSRIIRNDLKIQIAENHPIVSLQNPPFPTVISKYISILRVVGRYLYADSPLCDIPNYSSFTMVELVRHTLMDSTISFNVHKIPNLEDFKVTLCSNGSLLAETLAEEITRTCSVSEGMRHFLSERVKERGSSGQSMFRNK